MQLSVHGGTDNIRDSGGDALRGNTRTHPEHEGKGLSGRWYYIGDDMGEQVAAGLKKKNKNKINKDSYSRAYSDQGSYHRKMIGTLDGCMAAKEHG